MGDETRIGERPAAADGREEAPVGGQGVLVAGDGAIGGVVGLGEGEGRKGRHLGPDREVLEERAEFMGLHHGLTLPIGPGSAPTRLRCSLRPDRRAPGPTRSPRGRPRNPCCRRPAPIDLA